MSLLECKGLTKIYSGNNALNGVDLNLENRADVEEFCRKIEKSRAKPLNILADGDHVHTVAASSEVILDNIERALRDKGYLK